MIKRTALLTFRSVAFSFHPLTRKLRINWLAEGHRARTAPLNPSPFLISPPSHALWPATYKSSFQVLFLPNLSHPCSAFCLSSNQVFFLQVQSSPSSGQPPKQPCTGGLQSSLTCGLLESYSQSWSPKEECHTQVSAGHSRSGPLMTCFSITIWTSPHLPS